MMKAQNTNKYVGIMITNQYNHTPLYASIYTNLKKMVDLNYTSLLQNLTNQERMVIDSDGTLSNY